MCISLSDGWYQQDKNDLFRATLYFLFMSLNYPEERVYSYYLRSFLYIGKQVNRQNGFINTNVAKVSIHHFFEISLLVALNSIGFA